MEEQSIADYNQAVSAKADIGRDAIEMYNLEKWNIGDDIRKE